MASKEDIAFTSLGMLILDKVQLPSGQVFEDVLGGSGSYAILGARLFSSKAQSLQVGYTIHRCHDFPPQISHLLEGWRIILSVTEEEHKLSTRGMLHYLDQSLATKSFKYLTTPIFTEPKHLSLALLRSRSFHFFASPSEFIGQIGSLLALRRAASILERPLIIWEPRASSCVPENQGTILYAMNLVDVFSPNHIELAQIVGIDVPTAFDRGFLERICSALVPKASGPLRAMLVVRAGKMGCLVQDGVQSEWLPAYHPPLQSGEEGTQSKVVDTTGAGNAFLGAFAIACLESEGDVTAAACAGNVAASFVVEQVGMPMMTISEDGDELWNGESVFGRLQKYRMGLGLSLSENCA